MDPGSTPDWVVQIVEADHRLEGQAAQSARDLMAHRWHWTLDESNPQRLSVVDYAARVGKAASVIQKDAKAFLWLTSPQGAGKTADEARERVGRAVDQDAAIAAVATEYAQSYGWVRRGHSGNRQRVDAVLAIARRRAEEQGTPIEDEAALAAQLVHHEEQARKEHEDWLRRQHSVQFVAVQAEIARLHMGLNKIINEGAGAAFSAEERDQLRSGLATIPQKVETADQVLSGKPAAEPEHQLYVVPGGVS